jgi:ParB family transcriptional regulator, chromosome partitioning protein
MAKKKPKISNKITEIFPEQEEDLADDLFDVSTTKGLVSISMTRLTPNPNQPRKSFYDETITELSESIKEQGVLSPIIVRPSGENYEIIAGERRYRAAEKAGLKEIPALIRKVSNGDAKVISLIENIQREDLNDIDRASALKELKTSLKLSWEKMAKKLGLSKRRVLDLVGLLDLPEEVKEDIRQKKLTERHGRALRQLLKKPDTLRDTTTFVKENKVTGEQTQELVKLINGEPRFTIEEAYKQIIKAKPKKPKAKKGPLEKAISDSDRLIKTIEKLKSEKLTKEKRGDLHSKLVEIQEKIEKLIKNLESNKTTKINK